MEINFDSAAPQRGLLQGLQTGMNAGKLIMEERRLQEAQAMAKKQMEMKQASDKLVQASSLMKESWATPKFKMALYNQSKDAAKVMGFDLPEITEWNDVATDAAKKIHDIMSKGMKQGLAPDDLRTMVAEVLVDANEQARKQTEPLLQSLGDKASNSGAQDIRGQARLDANDDRNRRYLESQTTKFSKNLEDIGTPEAITQFRSIQDNLPPVGEDIPGFGMAGSLVPGWLLSPAGRALRQAVQGLQNVKIKDRSGAAVTPPEFVRLKEEFGTGKFKTEAQLRQGLQVALDTYRARTKNAYAGYTPEVRAAYFGNQQIDDYLETFNKMNFTDSAAKPGKLDVGAGGITATNPKTGEKIISQDGGKTWKPLQ